MSSTSITVLLGIVLLSVIGVHHMVTRNHDLMDYHMNRFSTWSVDRNEDVFDREQLRNIFEKDELARGKRFRDGGVQSKSTALIPNSKCSFEVRIGNVDDGGKIMCAPWKCGNSCVVYSLGVGGDNTWETSLIEAVPQIVTYSFDKDEKYANLFEGKINQNFYPYFLSATDNVATKQRSIPSIMTELGHKRIEILKMDIEGSEFEMIEKFLPTLTNGAVCQLLLEVHFRRSIADYIIFEQLETAGFVLFAKENNYYCATCHEYSFAHKTCLQQYGISEAAFKLAPKQP